MDLYPIKEWGWGWIVAGALPVVVPAIAYHSWPAPIAWLISALLVTFGIFAHPAISAMRRNR
jgi:hypothetical protein